MNGPYFLIDLNPHWSFFNHLYMTSPARLVGSFDHYLTVVVNMYTAMTNDTSEDEVLIDHYLNGACVQLTPLDEETTRQAVLTGLDRLIGLADICGCIDPGNIIHSTLDLVSRTVFVQFGGERDQA